MLRRISPPVGGPRLEPPGDAANGLFPGSAFSALLPPLPRDVTGDAPSELELWAILGPSLPDKPPDSDADSAELAAASILPSRLARLMRAAMALTLVPSGADAQPLVELVVSGVADADEEAIARTGGGGEAVQVIRAAIRLITCETTRIGRYAQSHSSGREQDLPCRG